MKKILMRWASRISEILKGSDQFPNFSSLIANRRLPGSRVRLRDRTCGQVCGCMGYTCVNRGRASGGVSSQRRALSDANQDDGLPSLGGRSIQTYPTAFRVENRRPTLPQSRNGQQQRQFRMPFHAQRCIHGAQSNARAQKL